MTLSHKWMLSIITTGKSSLSSGRCSHSSNCCWLKATKRRDTALLEVAEERSCAGS
jgi:hypothetical protein